MTIILVDDGMELVEVVFAEKLVANRKDPHQVHEMELSKTKSSINEKIDRDKNDLLFKGKSG
jgi:hypothetical protein